MILILISRFGHRKCFVRGRKEAVEKTKWFDAPMHRPYGMSNQFFNRLLLVYVSFFRYF